MFVYQCSKSPLIRSDIYQLCIFCVLQAQTFKEDFEQERKDREKAHSQLGEIEKHYKDQLQSMEAQLKHTEQDLQKTKETLMTTDTVLHSQIEQLSERLIVKNQQVAATVAENDRLQEEVLSKTQQVEQYKQQVDQYHNRVCNAAEPPLKIKYNSLTKTLDQVPTSMYGLPPDMRTPSYIFGAQGVHIRGISLSIV